MNTDVLARELESIVNKGLEDSPIPYAKGNSIRIKNIVIRHNDRKGYLIYDIETNKQVARTQFKSTAIAIAKNLASGKNVVKEVLEYDINLTKHYNDALFYRHVIKKTTDPIIRETRSTRLELSIARSKLIREKIDKIIFGLR